MAQRTSVTYTPKSRLTRFTWSGASPRAYLDLLVTLVRNQLKIRYRYTVIGFGWAFVNPILQMLVYAYVFGSIFSGDRANFKLVLLAGLLPWQAFASSVTMAPRALLSNRDLLRKAPFPSELLPISSVATSMVNFVIVFVVFVAFLLVRGFPALSQIHWVLAAIVISTVLMVGISLLVSSLNVFFRDVEQLIGFVIWIWFFLTPIVYPLARLGRSQAKILLGLNPMAGVVTSMQTALIEGDAPPLDPLLAAAGISVVVFALGWWTFRRLQYELPKVV